MNGNCKRIVISVAVLAIVFGGGYGALVLYTGSTLPFSSVVSESMQHDNYGSQLGTIDTGDIVVVRDPDKTDIYSYVEGLENGYQSFGSYGSVIIYNRDGQNPVIHRAILWLEYNGDGTWSAPDLENLEEGSWYYVYTVTDAAGNEMRMYGHDPYSIHGMLCFTDLDGKTPYIDLDALAVKSSGYLTMGDNPITNPNFDQQSGIVNHLIAYEDIKSVPIMEIPWMGCLKLLMNGSSSLSHVPNSLPSLLMGIVLVFSVLIILDLLTVLRYNRRNERRIARIEEWSRM